MSELGDNAAKTLRNYVERIEAANEAIDEQKEVIKEIKAAAKCEGFDPKIVMAVVKMRQKNMDDVREALTLTQVYARALDLDFQTSTTLGQYVAEKVNKKAENKDGRQTDLEDFIADDMQVAGSA